MDLSVLAIVMYLFIFFPFLLILLLLPLYAIVSIFITPKKSIDEKEQDNDNH